MDINSKVKDRHATVHRLREAVTRGTQGSQGRDNRIDFTGGLRTCGIENRRDQVCGGRNTGRNDSNWEARWKSSARESP